METEVYSSILVPNKPTHEMLTNKRSVARIIKGDFTG
jgi:hypothetical protein